MIGETASESTGEMIGDDASEGGGNSYRAELGWVRDILVEAEEVGVGEERDDPAVDVTIVDALEEETDGFVDVGIFFVNEANEDIERVHEKATRSTLVLLTDGGDDIPGKLSGTGLRGGSFLLDDGTKGLTEPVGEAVGILIRDMLDVILGDGCNCC